MILINLYTTYYEAKDPKRKNELLFCINKNSNNLLIDKIYVLCENKLEYENSKINLIRIDRRPTFNDFFYLINQNTGEDDINIISNTDIYFNESLKLVDKINHFEKKCLALGRWDIINDSKLRFCQNDYSQDTWIFKGKIRNLNGDIPLGIVGCDNKIANEISKGGYKIINPSLSIITIHYHRSSFRNYNNKYKLNPPYRFILPTPLKGWLGYVFKYSSRSDYYSLLFKKYKKAYYLRSMVKLMIKILNRLDKDRARRLKKYYFRKLT